MALIGIEEHWTTPELTAALKRLPEADRDDPPRRSALRGSVRGGCSPGPAHLHPPEDPAQGGAQGRLLGLGAHD